jgi:GMP synthase-like glutamine amidotransferase
MRALVLQHIACEPPGVYEDVLRERGATIYRVELDEGEALPDWREFDVIVAMGGPMSVNDETENPWLVDEKWLIAEAVQAGVPFFGACLGAQLLAASLGARVYPGAEPEVGLLPVSLTDAAVRDPLFAGLPRELLTFQWHADAFDLPTGAELLATSPLYPHQVFRWGSRAYGVQFHLEVSTEIAKEWADIPAYSEALERMLGPGSLAKLIEELRPRADELRAHGRQIFERWLDLRGAPRRRNACDGAVDTVDTSAERAVHRVD